MKKEKAKSTLRPDRLMIKLLMGKLFKWMIPFAELWKVEPDDLYISLRQVDDKSVVVIAEAINGNSQDISEETSGLNEMAEFAFNELLGMNRTVAKEWEIPVEDVISILKRKGKKPQLWVRHVDWTEGDDREIAFL